MDMEQLLQTNYFRTYYRAVGYYADRRVGTPRHYINYRIRGCSRYVTQDSVLEVGPGDLYYVPMGLQVEIFGVGEEPAETISCGFMLFPEARKKRFCLQKLPREFIPEIQKIPTNYLPDTMALAQLYTLLSKLLPHMKEETVTTPALLEKLSELIRQDPSARVPTLAKECGVSESSLYVQVKALSGKTPNEFRMDVVMSEALRLLASSDIPVHLLADQLGFSSANYFRKVFREHTGLTPTRLRNRPTLD